MRKRVSDYEYDKDGYLIPPSTIRGNTDSPPVGLEEYVSCSGVEGKEYIYNKDILSEVGENTSVVSVSGQLSGQDRDESGTSLGLEHGELVKAFDTFLYDNREAHRKQDVLQALKEILGKDISGESFRKVLQRRTGVTCKILYGGDRIQYQNSDWKASKITTLKVELPSLRLRLPFDMDVYVKTLPKTTMVVAGEVGSGKTHYSLELAKLNLGKLPIRFFFAESGTYRMQDYLQDYPDIAEAIDRDDGTIDIVNTDIGDVDVLSSLDPDGLNLYDYLRMQAGDRWWLNMQLELREYAKNLETGMLIVNLQKPVNRDIAFGGEGTTFQCDIGVTLHVRERVKGDADTWGYKMCRLDIGKARDWAGKVNPEVMSVDYRTAGFRGKLKMIEQSWGLTEVVPENWTGC